MEILALLIAGDLLLSLYLLVYVPVRLVAMQRNGLNVWLWLTRKKLILMALVYLFGALFLWVVSVVIAVGGVGGSNAAGNPIAESILTAASIGYLCLGIGTIFTAYRRHPSDH